MALLINTDVTTLGRVPTVPELAAQNVVARYSNDIAILAIAFATDPGALTALDATAFTGAIADLKDLVKNGMPDVNDPSITRYVSLEMARHVNVLLHALESVDFVGDVDSIKRLQDISDAAELQELFQSFFIAVNNNRSLQAFIELEYVKTGNDILFESMEDLRDAIAVNKEVLKTLADLQEIKNLITPEDIGELNKIFTDPLSILNTDFDFSVDEAVDRNDIVTMNSVYTTSGTLVAGATIDVAVKELFAWLNTRNPDSDDFVGQGFIDDRAEELFPGFFTVKRFEKQYNEAAATGDNYPPGYYEVITNEQTGEIEARPGDLFGPGLMELEFDVGGGVMVPVIVPIFNNFPTDANGNLIFNDDPDDNLLFTFTKPLPFHGFEEPIQVMIPLNDMDVQETLAQLPRAAELKLALEAHIVTLDSLNPDLTPEERESSIIGKLEAVIADITDDSGNLVNIGSLNAWVLDNFDKIGDKDNAKLSGDFQRRLTEAIAGGENLNDTQKEDLRRLLFVFEEFYKSASALLTKITQLIEKMAQAISR